MRLANRSFHLAHRLHFDNPWDEKKLFIELSPFSDELAPGEEVSWGLEVKNQNGLPQETEVLIFMYDRSLEYYKTSGNPWLDSLYNIKQKNK